MLIQKENYKSKPKKIVLKKAYFLGHPNSGSCVQNAKYSSACSLYYELRLAKGPG